jgi:hypothetical protein
MARLFVSYVHDDSRFVRRLVGRLADEGFDTWYYERDAVAGTNYLDEITKAMASSEAFIVVISEATLAAPVQVHSEIITAHELGKPKFPLLLNLSYEQLRQRRRDWVIAMAGAIALTVMPATLAETLPKLLVGLRQAGARPEPRTVLDDIRKPVVSVIGPDGQLCQRAQLGGEGLKLGRAADNDICVDHPNVSRHHLRLDWNGRSASVTDLESRNGTWLGATKLAPNKPRRWQSGEVLSVSGYVLQLDLRGEAGTQGLGHDHPDARA